MDMYLQDFIHIDYQFAVSLRATTPTCRYMYMIWMSNSDMKSVPDGVFLMVRP